MGAAIYCEQCMQIFAGVPRKREPIKPLPIVEPVSKTIEPYRSPAAGRQGVTSWHGDGPIEAVAPAGGIAERRILEELRLVRKEIANLQAGGAGPPRYANGKQLRDMSEVVGVTDIAAGSGMAFSIDSGRAQWFSPYGVRMKAAPKIQRELNEALSLHIGAIVIAGYPQENVDVRCYDTQSTSYMQSDLWDQPWPVPVRWGIFGRYLDFHQLEIHVRNPYHVDAHLWVGIMGQPLNDLADPTIVGVPRGHRAC